MFRSRVAAGMGISTALAAFSLKNGIRAIQSEKILATRAACRPSLNLKYQIARLSVRYRYVLASGRVIIVDIETQGSVDTHLAFEMGIVWEELAHEIALESKVEYITPKGERGFILYPIEFSVDTFFIR